MKNLIVSTLSGLLFLLLLTSTAFAHPAAAKMQVPFKGRSSGVVTTVGIDPVAGLAYLHAEGQGQATHLGHFTQTGDTTVDLATGIPLGTWTLTAANGDKLFLTMTAYGIDPTHGVGTFTVVGGTGRFEGASGSYTQLITFTTDPASSPSTAYTDALEGTISFGHQ